MPVRQFIPKRRRRREIMEGSVEGGLGSITHTHNLLIFTSKHTVHVHLIILITPKLSVYIFN